MFPVEETFEIASTMQLFTNGETVAHKFQVTYPKLMC